MAHDDRLSLFRFIDMDTRANVYGQRGVLNLRPCIKMLQQNGCRLAVQHWPTTATKRNREKTQKTERKKNKRFNSRIIINVVVSTAINNRWGSEIGISFYIETVDRAHSGRARWQHREGSDQRERESERDVEEAADMTASGRMEESRSQ